MALDKQRILSELGSVMNQLQSADCGCMGKLFSNNNGGQGGGMAQLPTYGGCRRGCCRGHGYNNTGGLSNPCAGEPCSANRHCMGSCNPPKLYADTYNYLNHNLMQPMVKEVYNDLKSITPANTVMNNPMAGQMGLSQQGQPQSMSPDGNQMTYQMQGNNNMGMQQYLTSHGAMDNRMEGGQQGNMGMFQNCMPESGMGNQMQEANMNTMANQQMLDQKAAQMMGGMGPNIVNMMGLDSRSKPPAITEGQTAQNNIMEPMALNAQQAPYSQVAVPVSGMNPEHNNMGNTDMSPGMSNIGNQMHAPSYFMRPNVTRGGNVNTPNSLSPGMQQVSPNSEDHSRYSNQTKQPMASNNVNYGQHTQGMTKFNEMFPGVMRGDLGFDPMAIAIQMNPANHQQTVMQTMQKLMNGTDSNKMQPAITGANTVAANLGQSNGARKNQPNMLLSHEQAIYNQPVATQQGHFTPGAPPTQANDVLQQQAYNNYKGEQQVYTALAATPATAQSQPTQEILENQVQQIQSQHHQNNMQYLPQPPQQIIDPNTGAAMIPPNFPNTNEYESSAYTQKQLSPQQYAQYESTPAPMETMIKDPIFPADSSRFDIPHNMRNHKQYQYNTLGQPIQPAKVYRPAQPNLPQTLSPQPVLRTRTDCDKFNVKSTVSKTSLMGNRPVGRTPSRSQLQHIYNQYKGSRSYTQQNVLPPVHGSTYSDGKLNVAPASASQQRSVPVEKLGGDTMANNQAINNLAPMKEMPMENIGDVPAVNKPYGDVVPVKEPAMKQGKLRNGLQDMVYTSYLTSAAWTFHGDSGAPYSRGYRYKNRA